MSRFRSITDKLEIGLGVTELAGSDKYPYEIIAIKDDRHITIRKLDYKRTDNRGMSDIQDYVYSSNESNETRELFKTKQGIWRERVGRKLGFWVFVVGRAEYYYDFSF